MPGSIGSSCIACYAEARGTRRWNSARVRVLPLNDVDPDPASSVADRQLLEDAFGRLSPEHRAVVVLHHHLGYPLTEIAATLGVPVGTARSRLHYAVRQLRTVLDADDRVRRGHRGATRMNRSDEPLFDPRIADWLEDDPYEAPQQALDVVLAAFPSITQRHAARVPWRFLDMSSPLKLAFAAAAIAVVVGGVFFLGPWRTGAQCGGSAYGLTARQPIAVAATSSPTVPPVTGLPGTFVFRRDDGDRQ